VWVCAHAVLALWLRIISPFVSAHSDRTSTTPQLILHCDVWIFFNTQIESAHLRLMEHRV
jgi:hypothetical protein